MKYQQIVFRIAVASNEYDIHVWDLTQALQSPNKDVITISNETEAANGKSVNEQPKNDDVTEKSTDTIDMTEESTDTNDVTEKSTDTGDVTGTETVKILTPVHSKPTVVLSGHIQRVIFVAWSPHEDGKLLSVSYDNTAQVRVLVSTILLRSVCLLLIFSVRHSLTKSSSPCINTVRI